MTTVQLGAERLQILDLDQPLANQNDLRRVSNTADPAIA